IIKSVDENQDLLRISVASAGHHHRLGGYEAPPAIISMYVGDELLAVLESIKNGTPYDNRKKSKMTIGVDVLPPIPRDSTDRNRTSPFAFTGNKFEFRSVGSSLSIAGPNTTINAMVAYTLKTFADELEKADDFNTALQTLIKREITAHWRIIFNGNGYDEGWVREAEKRGLLNLRTLPDAMTRYLDAKNVALFTELGVYTKDEMADHYEIKLEKYSKVLNIEVEVMLEMIHKDILPSAFRYMQVLATTVSNLKAAVSGAKGSALTSLLSRLDTLTIELSLKEEELARRHEAAEQAGDCMAVARAYADSVLPAMAAARAVADEIEPLLGEDYKPYPSYEDLLFMR
ncbi:MAG: glutamine synthetase type III, partial [Treponema sp.]|nr:glutamine synthetase type III [Treponema sp.]